MATGLGTRILAGGAVVIGGIAVALVASQGGAPRAPAAQPKGEPPVIQRTLAYEADSTTCTELVGRGDSDADPVALRAVCDSDAGPSRAVDSLGCLQLDGLILGYRCLWAPRDGGVVEDAHTGVYDRCACSVWIRGDIDVSFRADLNTLSSNAHVDKKPSELPSWATIAPSTVGQTRERMQPCVRVGRDAGPCGGGQ